MTQDRLDTHGMSWEQWRANMLNRLFVQQGVTKRAARVTAAMVRHGETQEERVGWGAACQRGFISDARFGSGQVIKRTNRNVTRKWRAVG